MKEDYFDKLYGDVFPDWLRDREASELEPRCTYCGVLVDLSQQFCCENCENAYYDEADLYWADREEENDLRKKED